MVDKNPNNKRNLIFAVGLIIIVIIGLSSQFGTNGEIKSSGQTRKYLLYVPETYDPEIKTPLVISIHGFVQWPAHQQDMSGWNALADENGFLVVYPKGTGFPLRWNIQPSEDNPSAEKKELQFFADLIDHLSDSNIIDPSRIYVNGMSNGGGMSDLLACEFSDRIAAIGGVAGAYVFPEENCQPSRPMPVIAFHGLEDEIVPYLGGTNTRGKQFILPAIEDWAAGWADLNSCDPSPKTSKVTDEITRSHYSSCAEDAEVILYTIADGGHTWPGGEKLPVWITGYTNPDINASALMWEFFRNYSLDPP